MFIYGLFLVSRVHRAKAGGSYSARRRTPTLLLVMCLVSAIRPDKAEINKSKGMVSSGRVEPTTGPRSDVGLNSIPFISIELV